MKIFGVFLHFILLLFVPPLVNPRKSCPFCPAYTPGRTAQKIVEKHVDVDQNSRQTNQELASHILDRLTVIYPMYRFMVIVYNAEFGVHCEERESNRKTFVQYNIEVTDKFPIKGGKCVVVVNSLSNQQFIQNTECHGELGNHSCATKPAIIAKEMSSNCQSQLSALGVFSEDFVPAIAHSMPRHAFGQKTLKCAETESDKKWHLVIVLQQNYSMIGELLHLNYSTLVARTNVVTEEHHIPLILFVFGILYMTVLIILIFFMTIVILFLYNFHGRIRRIGCFAQLKAYCFFGQNAKYEEELNPNKIDIEQLVYSGPNSRVYFGHFWPNPVDRDRVRPVAIKVPSKEAFQIGVIKREMRINAVLHHPRIVAYIGFYRDAFQNIRIVSEFMAGGDLHTHLCKRKENNLTVGKIFNFIMQIAEGMEYLMSMQIIHRDLAARNCMLNAECTEVKISDFGLSRHFGTEEMYACSSPVRLPLRWIAIECFGKDGEILPYCQFSEKTDVWAFGMVVWECFAYGELPYGQEEVRDVLGKLRGQDGAGSTKKAKLPWRLPCPANCPQQIYTKLMLKCWETKPEHRPTFKTMKKLLEEIFNNILEEEPDMMTKSL